MKDLILFQSNDETVTLPVNIDSETVWLSLDQMTQLFDRDKSVVSRHINNIFREKELEKNSVVSNFATTAADGKTYKVNYYNLDIIISVGYRVKSKRGVEFRRWANGVLKDYILKGYAVNNSRLEQLGQTVQLMKRALDSLDSSQILSVVESYTSALDLLDDYDHQCVTKPKGTAATYVLEYDECRRLIDSMKFTEDSTLFGNEKDDSFKGSIGAIYQSFGGQEIYPSLQEKAANLLYFIVKNHSFSDGNKRIAAAMFLYFLDKNKALFRDGAKVIDDSTLVAITIMSAESRPEEKEIMINLIMNFLK